MASCLWCKTAWVMHNHSENDSRGAPLPPWPSTEEASGGPPVLPPSPHLPSSPPQAPSSPTAQADKQRDWERERQIACSLTHWQLFMVKRRAVLRQNTLSAQNQHNVLWRCSLGDCRGDRVNPGRIYVGLPAGSDSKGWITVHSLKKNDS